MPTPYESMRELLTLTGLPEPEKGAVEIVGDDPVVRTPYRVGNAGAASQAAIGVAISELWKLRTGRGQNVKVDVRPAGFNLKGAKFTFIDGEPLTKTRVRNPWFTFYPTRDNGFVRVHTSFEHHREALMRVLGNPADVEAAQKITQTQWDAVALEDALHAAGGCAAAVRTTDEWHQHPQYAAIEDAPLIDIRRIGDAPPESVGGSRPLDGVRVLDLTRVIAGPICGRTLAEHGADVMKINAKHLPDTGVQELDTGLGKLSAFLDLRQDGDLATLRGLLKEADVFSQGYRPGSLAARGFSPEEAAKIRPGIIYVELSAWGFDGPWKGRRGYDTMVQAASGMSLMQGNGTPEGMPVSVIDYVTGYLMALGVMTALRRRATEGGSWHVRCSLARSGKWIADRGLIDPAVVAATPDPSTEEIERLYQDTQSPIGIVRHLRPALELSETMPRWARPPVPLGHNAPEWPKTPVGSTS